MDIHVYLHNSEDHRLRKILEALTRLEHKMSEMSDKVDGVVADVTAENSLVDSAVTLIKSIPDLIAAASANSTDPATVKKLDDLSAAIKAKTQALSDALTANTPVTPAQAAAT